MKYPSYSEIRAMQADEPGVCARLLLTPGQHMALDVLDFFYKLPGFQLTWAALGTRKQNAAFKQLAQHLCESPAL
jgi:hypothetical protein